MGTTNVTIRMNEEELRKLDELAQRMGVTRSDVIRSLVNNFEEALRREVERERKRWMAVGFVAALESAILDPEVVLRFVRRNVDVLGYPDFLIGMVRVRNRVVVFSHQDKVGHQLLQLVRSRIEDEVKREEMEMEQGDDGDEDSEGSRAAQVRIPASRPVRPNTVRAAPVATNHKLVGSNRAMPPAAKPTATFTVGKPVNNNGGGSAKSTVTASASENKKSATSGVLTTHNLATTQAKAPNPQAGGEGGATGPSGPVESTPVGKPAGDFIIALISHSYHKHRNELLRLVESIAGG